MYKYSHTYILNSFKIIYTHTHTHIYIYILLYIHIYIYIYILLYSYTYVNRQTDREKRFSGEVAKKNDW